MAAKFFGQFLLEKGLISREQLLQALELQRASNPLLGELAVELGMLDAHAARRINARQRREDKRFGDIACEMGLLDDARVGQLLAEQGRRRKLFGTILLEISALDAAALDRELALHRSERELAVQTLELGLAGHPRAVLAGAAIDTAVKLFGRVLKTPCQFSSLLDPAAVVADHGVEIAISGEQAFRVALLCDEATVYGIAAGFLGGSAGIVDGELARDAFGEFLNIVMGYVVQETLPPDTRYQASPPRMIGNGERPASGDPHALAIGLTSAIGDVTVVLRGS